MENNLSERFSQMGVAESPEADRPIDLHNFQPVKCLGQGTYGTVVLMYDRRLDRNVVVKLISLEKDPEYPRQYLDIQTEAQILKKLAGKSFFCQYYFTCTTKKYAWFCMQYYPGGTLEDLFITKFSGESKLSFSVAQCLLAEIVLAVGKLHKHSILHRDIKPNNFLVDEAGHVVLVDFGLSRILDKNKATEDQTCREPFEAGNSFTAPETVGDSRPYSYPADFYSVGVMLRHVCTEAIMDDTWNNDNKNDVKDLHNMLTNEIPSERPSFKSVRKHNFFRGINWKDVEHLKLNMTSCQPPKMPVQKPDNATGIIDLGSLEKAPSVSSIMDNFSCYQKYV